jgi:hypothetical protein
MRLIFALLFILSFLSTSYTQVKEDMQAMSFGVNNSFSIVLSSVDKKLVDELWKDYIRKYGGKYKWDKKWAEHQLPGAIIGNIHTSKPVNIYASSKAIGQDVLLTTWFQMDEEFISSEKMPQHFEAVELQLQHFAREVSREKLRLQIKEEEKQFSRIETDLQRLARKKDQLENEIEKARKRIEEAEREIQYNLEEQGKTKVNLQSQKENLEQLRQKLHDM